MMSDAKQALIRRRFRRAMRKHTLLLLTQIMFSGIVTLLWWMIVWRNHWHIEKEDAEFYLAGVIFLGSAAWVLKGTEVFRVVWDQYRQIVTAVKRADTETIIELKD